MRPPPGTGAFSHFVTRAVGDGKHGVYLFFTISGVILALPFARHHLQGGSVINLRSYFKRRITRLEPSYVLVMLLCAPALLFVKATAVFVLLLHLLASLFYVHNLAYGKFSIINPPAWSLEIEIQFYLLAPLLTTIFALRNTRLRRAILLAVILPSGLIAPFFITPDTRVSLTLLNFFQYFAAGFLLCDLYPTRTHFALPHPPGTPSALLPLPGSSSARPIGFPVLLPFATIALYMAGFFGRLVRTFFFLPAISNIGGMCYSIYLTHTAVLTAAHSLLAHAHIGGLSVTTQTILTFSSSGAAILAAGTVFFTLIEPPCMNPTWPHQLYTRLRRPA